MKKNFGLYKIGFGLLSIASIFVVAATEISAQIRRTVEQANVEAEDDTWWYVTLLVLALGLAGAVLLLLKNKKSEKKPLVKERKAVARNKVRDSGSVDLDREMEWLRKNQKLLDKKPKKPAAKKIPQNLSNPPEIIEETEKANESVDEAGLPVFNFKKIEPAKPFSPLPLSNDEALLSAIEQAQDEYEEDEEVRDLALRILTAFKNRNSIEALSQVALYDLSSTLRSRAVLTLTEFDHESVFEAILLACADPTREVRAAAARGLTRLSFDRADAWARISETGEKGRIRQAARAAMESGFVERAFDRLIHPDRQYAYEAFVLLALLIKAGENEPIFNALKNHKDKKVQFAILHLLKITQDEEALSELYKLLEDKKISAELKAEINKTAEDFSMVAI